MNGVPLVLLLLLALPVAGQSIRGTVLEEGSDSPIEGAMVIVMAADQGVVARTLTDVAGRFVSQVAHAGQYRVRIDRIGYESLTTEFFHVPLQGAHRRILVPVHAVELEGLDISGSRRCQLRSEVGQATAAVWQEARTALEAAAWTRQSGRYRYTLLHFVRYLDPGGRKILHEDRNIVHWYGQDPYVSQPAQILADSGYARELPDGRLTYFAPDAEVLLSDAFLDTHCMRLQAGGDGLVGLAFEPIKGRKKPDIRGVIWMRAATAALTRLEFRYTNLDRGPATGDAGGVITFSRLPGGSWIVRGWHVHMPLLEVLGWHRYRHTGYQDEGGEVRQVVDLAGIVVYDAILAGVSGRVTDSLGTEPLAGAVVRARGLDRKAVSDARGAFALSHLPGGRIVLDVSHPSLDTLGLVSPDAVTLDVAEGEVRHHDVRVPGVYEVLAQACGGGTEEARASKTAIVLGRVLKDGLPAAGDTVRVGWLSPGRRTMSVPARAAPPGGTGPLPTWKPVRFQEQPWLQTTLDSRGTFLLCDVPSPSQLRVMAVSGKRTALATVTIPLSGRAELTTLVIPPGGDP